MKSKLIPILIANLFAVTAAAAAGNGTGLQVNGDIGLGYRYINKTGSDTSKLTEYQDLDSSSAISSFNVNGNAGQYYFDATGENLGLDDQYIDLKGGDTGLFKYHLYNNDLRHNLTTGAISPFSGIGSSSLTGLLAPNTSTSTWNSFDYSYKRNDTGGSVEFSAPSTPWFARVAMNQVKRNGVKPISYVLNSFGGAPVAFSEMPLDVDYTDNNYTVQGGYSTNRLYAALSWTQAKFSNGAQQFSFTDPAPSPYNGTDVTQQPPDNTMDKINGDLVFKQLPLYSTLAGRFSQSKTTDSVAVVPTALGVSGVTSSSPVFNGNEKNSSASLSLTSSPADRVNTHIYWNWYQHRNDSTQIIYSDGTVADLFSYRKNNLGADASYRFNDSNRVSGGLDWTNTHRDRVDYDSTKDTKVYAQWQNNSIDMLDVKVRYQYLRRRAGDQQLSYISPTVAGTDYNYLDYAINRFDVSSLDQNLVKLSLDLNPVPLLDLGLEASYKKDNYKDTIVGLNSDKRQEYYANLSYGDPSVFRVSFFGDVELVQYNSISRYVNGSSCSPTLNCDPSAAGSANAYTWNANNTSKNYEIGLGADWPVMERLTLRGSLLYSQTSGTVDFTGQALQTYASFPTNVGTLDDSRQQSVNLKAVYKVNKHWNVTGGYAYQELRYADAQMANYTYVVNTGTAATYLTGAFANPNYTANIVYAMAQYKF